METLDLFILLTALVGLLAIAAGMVRMTRGSAAAAAADEGAADQAVQVRAQATGPMRFRGPDFAATCSSLTRSPDACFGAGRWPRRACPGGCVSGVLPFCGRCVLTRTAHGRLGGTTHFLLRAAAPGLRRRGREHGADPEEQGACALIGAVGRRPHQPVTGHQKRTAPEMRGRRARKTRRMETRSPRSTRRTCGSPSPAPATCDGDVAVWPPPTHRANSSAPSANGNPLSKRDLKKLLKKKEKRDQKRVRPLVCAKAPVVRRTHR